MNRNSLIVLLVLLLSENTGVMASHTDPVGRKIYESKCARCHGENGTRGLLGAKNLQASKLNDIELYTRISEGKRIMPSWKEKLTPEQIHQVVRYVKRLRSNHNQ